MSILRQISELKGNQENVSKKINDINDIADQMEELIGPAKMWNTLRPGFSLREFIENLEYIARENDL